MKKALKQALKFLQNTLVGGLFFLLPLFVVAIIFGKVWIKMIKTGTKLSASLGIQSVAGIGGGPLMTALMIIGICLVSGFLIKLTLFARFRNWFDAQLVKYIPGYEFYKISLERKITKDGDQNTRPTVLITISGVGQLGVIIEELSDGKKVVFVASKPNSREGNVYVVDDASIAPLDIDEAGMNKLLLMQGKGLKDILK